jgi:hypothetical protein
MPIRATADEIARYEQMARERGSTVHNANDMVKQREPNVDILKVLATHIITRGAHELAILLFALSAERRIAVTENELESLAIERGGKVTRFNNIPELPYSLPIDISEKEFMSKVIAYAVSRGFLVYHTHDSRRSEPGFPDLIFIRQSRWIVAELKTKGKKPTTAQSKWLKAFGAVCPEVFTWWPDDFKTIKEILK